MTAFLVCANQNIFKLIGQFGAIEHLLRHSVLEREVVYPKTFLGLEF